MSTADTDVKILLEREVARLEALSFQSLLERFTEVRRSRLSGRMRRLERKVEVADVVSDSGWTYEMEAWSDIESDDQLHIFVTIMGQDADGQWAKETTDIIARRADSAL